MGKSNAVFAARDAYKAQYMEKFDALYMREAGKITHKLYYEKNRHEYFIYLKIPSETVKNFYYDVVIKFYTNDNGLKVAPTLKDYQVQFFSNDPAFVYTYMYVFRKYNMLIEELKSKCPPASLKQAPTERNFYETPGYVKSIYFAYIFMKRVNLFNRSAYEFQGQKYSKNALLSQVASFDNKMRERDDLSKKQKAAERKNAAKEHNVKPVKGIPGANVRTTSTTKKVSSTSIISGTKRVSTTKKTGVVGKKKPQKKFLPSIVYYSIEQQMYHTESLLYLLP